LNKKDFTQFSTSLSLGKVLKKFFIFNESTDSFILGLSETSIRVWNYLDSSLVSQIDIITINSHPNSVM